MKYLATLILLGISVTLFSFTLMQHGDMQDHTSGNCAASVVDRTLCPKDTSALGVHHIAGYQKFFQAMMPDLATLLLATLFVLATLLSFVFFGVPPELSTSRIFASDAPVPPNTQRLIRWLALFEHSPSSLASV